MSIKLVSVNIERDKHLDRVIPFIQSEKPDVLCVQELNEKNIPLFVATMKSRSHKFSPMLRHIKEPGLPAIGVGIFSRLPVRSFGEHYYLGNPDIVPEIDHDMLPTDWESPANGALLSAEIVRHTSTFRVATTHFTWSPRGEVTNRQRQDVRAMLDTTLPLGELIFAGDFNAPRGGEIFSFINDHYHDAIPARYKTSIDISLHRAGKERPEELVDKMVDGLFLTPGYRAGGVRLERGVSDHCAVVAHIHIAGSRRIFNLWSILRW